MKLSQLIVLFAAGCIAAVDAQVFDSHSVESRSRESEESLGPLDVSHIRNGPKPTFGAAGAVGPAYVQQDVVQASGPLPVATIDLPFGRDEFRNYVVDFKRSAAESKVLEADCSEVTNPYRIQKPGYMIGIWDDKDSFANIDKIKCLRGDDEDDDDSHEVDDDVFFELDPNQPEVVVLDPTDSTHKPSCSDGFLLTGLTKVPVEYETAAPTAGHCLKLIRGKVDYDVCEHIATNAKQGGNSEPYLNWSVECKFGHAAVGVKVDGKRVKSLRCCKLTRSYI